MATEPLLRFKACHRGKNAADLLTLRRLNKEQFPVDKITRGPLAGCFRARAWDGSGKFHVYRFGRGFVLEFSLVIRPGYLEQFVGKPLPGQFDPYVKELYREYLAESQP